VCKCGSEVEGTHELVCDEFESRIDPEEVDRSFLMDAERARLRTTQNTAFLRRRTLAQANGHAKDYNLIAQ
jgi:hypothetical protein